MLTRKILMTAAGLGLAACTSYSSPPAYGPASYNPSLITSANKAPFGTYLVDGNGRAVYVLEGQRNHVGMDRCSGQCLAVWPPLHSAAPTAGGAVDPARLSTMTMHGAPHVTYAGWPLYYYTRDREPADTTGQHVTDAWGTWHLLSPSGEPIRPVGSGY